MTSERTETGDAAIDALFTGIHEASTSEVQREIFSELIVTARPQDWERIGSTLLEDIQQKKSSQLWHAFVELSPLLDPQFILPIYALVLESPGLSQLEFSIAVFDFREMLDLPPNQDSTNWSQLAQEFLSKK